MKYREYMAQFALLDETKQTLIGRMQQRLQHLRTVGAEALCDTTPVETPKKKNTFRMHPIRWAAIFTSIALVVAATPILAIFVPRNANVISSVKLDYMENLMVETEGVTAYSIRREEDVSAVSLAAMEEDESKAPAVSLLSGRLVEEEGAVSLAKTAKSRTYLYSTTESYEAGNIEYDETGIKKVTFMKNREVTEDVYDNNGKLIDSDRRIRQEELDAQINRLYTTEQFTFVQFVAPVEKSGNYRYYDENGKIQETYVDLRTDLNGNGSQHYDKNGVSSYDTGGYYTDGLSTTLIIDNTTGYIYKLKDLRISGFSHGTVEGRQVGDNDRHRRWDDFYRIEIDENDNLVFTDLCPNKDIRVYSAFSDRDGWAYVFNNTLQEVNAASKTVYINIDREREYKYLLDADGYVYLSPLDYSAILYRMENGQAVPYENHGIRHLVAIENLDVDNSSGCVCGFYDNLALFDDREGYSSLLSPACGYTNYGTDTRQKVGLTFGKQAGVSAWEWFDDDFDTLIVQHNGKLYYKEEIALSAYTNSEKVLTEEDLTPLSALSLEAYDSYYLSVGIDEYEIDGVYRYKGMNETTYYRVVRGADGGLTLEELTSKSYADNVFIFQPINK